MKWTALKTYTTQTLIEELERIEKRIAERAHQIFSTRGFRLGTALDDWLAAERDVCWKPAVEVCEKDNTFTIEAAVAGVEPKELDVQVTPDALLIKSDAGHVHSERKGTVHVCEFRGGQLFRLIRLPAPIDPSAVKADYRNGLLRITAPMATKRAAKKVKVKTV